MDSLQSFSVCFGLIRGSVSQNGIITVCVARAASRAKSMPLLLLPCDDSDSEDDNEQRDDTSENPIPLYGVYPRKPGVTVRHLFQDQFKENRKTD
jgi:hypothetical protein